ncbi:MAG: hypothetical protein GTN82_32245 [Candidatus Aminicenantes bacterium]|nr:hypothetical protein [Candidatus Aminicenantes bacterium]
MDVIMSFLVPVVFFGLIVGIPLLVNYFKEKREAKETMERREREKKKKEEETIERIKRYKKLEIDLSNKFQDDIVEFDKEKASIIHSAYLDDVVREGEEDHLMPFLTVILTSKKIIFTSIYNRFIFSLDEIKKINLYFGGIVIEVEKDSKIWKTKCKPGFDNSIKFFEYAESLGIPAERHTAVTEGRELERERMPSI